MDGRVLGIDLAMRETEAYLLADKALIVMSLKLIAPDCGGTIQSWENAGVGSLAHPLSEDGFFEGLSRADEQKMHDLCTRLGCQRLVQQEINLLQAAARVGAAAREMLLAIKSLNVGL